MNPSPELIDPHWVRVNELVARMAQNRAAMARLHAERAEMCAEALALVEDRVAQREAAGTGRGQPSGDRIPLREVIGEIGAALRVSDQTVQHWLGDGAALVSAYSATLDALREGRIDERHASAIIDGGAPIVDDDVRGDYETRILEVAEHETAPLVRRYAEVLAARLQPDVVDERHGSAHERRRSRFYDLEPGLSRMQFDLPSTLGHAVYDRITQMATALEGAGGSEATEDAGAEADGDAEGEARDSRTRDQRRVDIFCDLMLCGAPTAHGEGDALAAIRGTVQVTIPFLTLAGLGDEPALLAEHGPIDSVTARRIAADAPEWERVLVHPHTGEPIAVDRYRPSAQQRRLVNARDQHCRWPGCRRRAERCDADHTIAYADGGPTCAKNLALLCRRHHVLKHASPWRVLQLGAGSLEFTSPTGRVYRNDAPPVVQFVSFREPWLIPPDPSDPAPF